MTPYLKSVRFRNFLLHTTSLINPHADLRQRIIEAVELTTPHVLINTWRELEYRLDICRATTVAHIEVDGRA